MKDFRRGFLAGILGNVLMIFGLSDYPYKSKEQKKYFIGGICGILSLIAIILSIVLPIVLI